MRKASVVALVSCLTLGTAAFAAQAAKPAATTTTKSAATTTTTTTKSTAAKTEHAHGAVTAVDATANTLTVKDTYTVTSNTKITSKGKTITLADVKVGDMVNVWYSKNTDKNDATKITVTGATKTAKK
jgi:hypothetical protein